MRALIAALMLMAGTAYAGDPWDTTDKAIAAVAFTAMAVDWGQTRYVAKNPDLYYERNKFLGEHPSMGQVNAYFLATAVGTYLIADNLRPEYRKWFLGAVAVLEIGVTAQNRHVGVKIEF